MEISHDSMFGEFELQKLEDDFGISVGRRGPSFKGNLPIGPPLS